MTRPFTDDEKQAAVDRLVRSSVARSSGALGNRQTSRTFADVKDAAAGVMIFQSNAPYYVVKLGVDVVLDQLASAQTQAEDITDSILSTSRRVKPVEDVASLANARTALNALSGAQRSTLNDDITKVPAYQRFEQSTARFLNNESKSIRSSGNIVQTPQAARSRLATLVSDLKEQHEEVSRRVSLLAGAVADFDALQLPNSFAQKVIENAASSLSERVEELEALTPEQRLVPLRDVTLDVLTARSTVKGFGSLSPTRQFLYFDGNGGPAADLQHPATRASIVADIGGPYVITAPATVLVLEVEGDVISVDVPVSFIAALESFTTEPYEVKVGESDKFFIDVTGYPRATVALTPGVARTAAQVVADINAAITTQPVLAEPAAIQAYLQGEPCQNTVTGATATFTRIAGDWSTVPGTIEVGDWVLLEGSGIAGNDGWYTVSSTANLPTSFDATKETGSAVADGASTNSRMTLNKGARGLRIRYTDAYAKTSIENQESISIPTEEDTVVEDTQVLLGFPFGQMSTSAPTETLNVASFINDNPAVAPGGNLRLLAFQQLVALHESPDVTFHTLPEDALRISVSKLRTTATLSGTTTLATFTVTDTANAAVNDIAVIRSATNQNNVIDNWGVISGVTGTTITATMQSAVVPDAVTIDVGPDLRGISLPITLSISSTPADQSDGEYIIRFVQGISGSGPACDVVTDRQIVAHTTTGFRSKELTGVLGRQHLSLTSQDVSLATRLSVLSSAASSALFPALPAGSFAGDVFFNSLPETAVGTTPWFSLPDATSVEAGDYLELRDDLGQAPTSVIEIEEVDGNLLKLVDALPVDAATRGLAASSQVPAARVKKRRRDNYDQLKVSLDIWLATSFANSDRWFTELRRLLNPLIVNTNPVASDVQAALEYMYALQATYSSLTAQLEGYKAPLVEEVDRIIDAYRQFAAERAIDILIEGRFSDFFSLDQDETSYSGTVQKSIREVERRDLPVLKTQRARSTIGLLDQYEEPNFEFDFRDTEGIEEPDLPPDAYDYDGEAVF